MECPECGYNVEAGANFCPRCRHQFRDSESDPDNFTDDIHFGEAPILPAYGTEDFSEPESEERFSGKELQFLKIQLIQPAMLVIAGVALAGYVSFPQFQSMTVTFHDMTVPVWGAICVFAGIVIGGIFYGVLSFRLARFRSP